MLTVVEHDQHMPVPQRGDQVGERIVGTDLDPESGGGRGGQQTGVAERHQVDQPRAMIVVGHQPLGHRKRERGLADPARSGDRQRALARQPCREPVDGLAASNQSRHARRQVIWRGDRGSLQRLQLGFALDRSNQGVTAPGNRRDIATTSSPVAEPAPERADLEFEIAVLDKGAGPDPRH